MLNENTEPLEAFNVIKLGIFNCCRINLLLLDSNYNGHSNLRHKDLVCAL